MASARPSIYLIASCNGAGKTSFAKEFLPKKLKDFRFLNADEIARKHSASNPNASPVSAARQLLCELDSCLNRRESFVLESTLSGKTYVLKMRHALSLGYEVELHYLWLSSAEQSVARVLQRVREGGHSVPIPDVQRRYGRSLRHLVDDYLPLASRWIIWDSRKLPPRQMAVSGVDDINSVKSLIGL